MDKKTRIFICDDQRVVCDGLHAILSTVEQFEIAGMAYDGAHAIEMIPKTDPELMLMDLKMPVMNGIQATVHIRRDFPAIRILVLTTYDDDEWLFDSIRAGAHGYILKNTPRDGLVTAIEEALDDRTPVDPSVAGKLFAYVKGFVPPDTALLNELNDRERDVLSLLGRGLSNAAIANELYLSEGTVRNLISKILSKLEGEDRTQAALLAVRYGLK